MQPDLNKMMQEMAKAQQGMLKVQQELASATVEGSSGGGAVTVKCSGSMEFKSVKIKPEAVDPNDVGTLEDLVLMAVKDACLKAQQLGEQKMKPALGNIKMPPGLGF
ncbi:MAG TPA: YbaB/EbfC family nucleoid-associated protein [Drouetiella sp.]|jgi:nucleoid-associated protein EbfC